MTYWCSFHLKITSPNYYIANNRLSVNCQWHQLIYFQILIKVETLVECQGFMQVPLLNISLSLHWKLLLNNSMKKNPSNNGLMMHVPFLHSKKLYTRIWYIVLVLFYFNQILCFIIKYYNVHFNMVNFQYGRNTRHLPYASALQCHQSLFTK